MIYLFSILSGITLAASFRKVNKLCCSVLHDSDSAIQDFGFDFFYNNLAEPPVNIRMG